MGAMDITTNVGCRNKCSYCPQSSFVAAYKKQSDIMMMPFSTFTTCIDKLPHSVGLAFGGFSEPWLNPDCTKMVKYAYNYGYKKICVLTTLVGMSVEDVDALEDIPFADYDFRVHLPREEKTQEIPITDSYLAVLQRIRESKINATYHYHGGKLHHLLKPVIKEDASRILTIPRSVSVPKRVDIAKPQKKKGILKCSYDASLHFNELLPNGDVLLCCQDFAMNVKIGNLLTDDYDSLYKSKAFLSVKEGLADESSGIICRYCLISVNVDKGKNPFIEKGTGIKFFFYKLLLKFKNSKLGRNRLCKKIIKFLNLHKIKIDFGVKTLKD